jgi:hypothetical protein
MEEIEEMEKVKNYINFYSPIMDLNIKCEFEKF